jgi:hypothetical protein
MLESNFEQSLQAISLVALAVMGVFIGAQKILKNWRSTEAETSIITLMHTELERMSEQNTKLSVELGRLHSEIIALNGSQLNNDLDKWLKYFESDQKNLSLFRNGVLKEIQLINNNPKFYPIYEARRKNEVSDNQLKTLKSWGESGIF